LAIVPSFRSPLPSPFAYGRTALKDSRRMPSLTRFFLILALAGGMLYGLVYALATYVRPVTRPMVTIVPIKPPAPAPAQTP